MEARYKMVTTTCARQFSIACILYRYFPYGGLEGNFLRIAREGAARGHRIQVYTTGWEGDVPSGVDLHRIDPRGWRNHARLRSFAEQALARVRCEHHDAVLGFNKMPGLDAYYQADTCYAARVAGRPAWYRHTERYRIHVAFETAVFGPASGTRALMLSDQQAAIYSSFYGTPSDRLIPLPPGIDPGRAWSASLAEAGQALRLALGLSPEMRAILFVGSDFRRKGLDRVIHALASLPGVQRQSCVLWVVGRDRVGRYRRMASRLGVAAQVRFFGGRSDVPRFLTAADLLCHPAREENTGNVILEAIVAGLPVLTTANCGFASHVLAAGAGRVLPEPFDQIALDQVLGEALTTPHRSAWRDHGIAYGRNADLYSRAERVVDVLERIGS